MSERLEEIKEKCTGVSIATINLGNEYSLTDEVKWLINRVEELEKENKRLDEALEVENELHYKASNDADELDSQVRRYKQALEEIVADEFNWFENPWWLVKAKQALGGESE